MASMELWNMVETLKVRVSNPAEYERCVTINAEGVTNSGSLRLTQAEALQLRDDLSRAITEAATAAAKAVEVVA
jgi:hypothetical protein